MKQFNQQITVTVEVDKIAKQLLEAMNAENAHAEMLTETIIGSMLQSKHIGLLYNNLNGWTNDLDFSIGQIVNCKEEVYGYQLHSLTKDSTDEYKQKYTTLGQCKIVDINIFSNQDVKVQYAALDSKGTAIISDKWVAHGTLTAIVEPAEES